MKKLVLVALALALPGSAVQAQVTVDVARITCWQFVTYKVADPKLIAVWLDGYYQGRRGSTIVEPQALEESEEKVREYCIHHESEPLMQAVEKILGERG